MHSTDWRSLNGTSHPSFHIGTYIHYTITSLIPRSHLISMGNGNKNENKHFLKWTYTCTYAHPEFGEGGEEAASAKPGVPVLGLFHNHLQRLQNIDDVIDSTTISACMCVCACICVCACVGVMCTCVWTGTLPYHTKIFWGLGTRQHVAYAHMMQKNNNNNKKQPSHSPRDCAIVSRLKSWPMPISSSAIDRNLRK